MVSLGHSHRTRKGNPGVLFSKTSENLDSFDGPHIGRGHLQIEIEKRMISLPWKTIGCPNGHGPLENQRVLFLRVRLPDEATVI